MDDMNTLNSEETPKETPEVKTKKDPGKATAYWSGLLTGLLITLTIVVGSLLISLANRPKNPGKIEIKKPVGQNQSGQQGTKLPIDKPDMNPSVGFGDESADPIGPQDHTSEITYSDTTPEEVAAKIETLMEVLEYYYLWDLSEEDMYDGAYAGLVSSLGDQYTEYYTPSEYQNLSAGLEGIYYGIGAYVAWDEERNLCYISKLIKGTPAAASGMAPGDYYLKVDGVELYGENPTKVSSRIRGEEGTEVVVTVLRGDEELSFTLTRARVEAPTVEYEMKENQIGYIEITEFDTVTIQQFRDAINALYDEGMQALILDLRANPGGSVAAVCAVARELLPKGLIVYMEDKNGARTEYGCDGTKKIQIPMAVLVDENSASASEILAGAIQDHGVGVLIGTTTFGKGIVQTILELSDGSAVKVTMQNYFTPNGHFIHGVGITPDITVEWDREKYVEDGTDNQLEAAFDYIMTQLGR